MDDERDGRPKPKTLHEIGADLSAVSVDELAQRISLMEEEIARLRAEIRRKEASKAAADAFFRPVP